MSDRLSSPHGSLRALALASLIAMSVVVSGCGQKGPLYLPQQKKTRVPATPSNPTPDAPDTSGASGASGDTPGNSPTETSPSETSPPTSDSTPPA
jgi:predicted small lipoprotein YifL